MKNRGIMKLIRTVTFNHEKENSYYLEIASCPLGGSMQQGEAGSDLAVQANDKK